jgi:hypothetical protein
MILGPFSTYINIALDLTGKPDGVQDGGDSYASKILFHPPAGDRVRILRVYGDFIAWARKGDITEGSCEVGWGLKTTAPDGDPRITYPGYTTTPFANSFAWVQGAISAQQPIARLHYEYDTHVGGLLGPDNMLLSQAFVALNTTGREIHMEPTFAVVYQFE